MADRQAGIVRFADFELELESGALHRQGRRVSLQPQSFQVLSLLLERPGKVVTRDEFRVALWQPNVFVEFDTGLISAIKRLRDTLQDSAEHPRFIETIGRRGTPNAGYRFIAPVAPETGPSKITLAVLPFAALGFDPDPAFLDGLAEELTARFSLLAPGRCAVIARTSVVAAISGNGAAEAIGKRLKAGHLLRGSLRRSTSCYRVVAQLENVDDLTCAWAYTSDHPLREEDWLGVQSEIAQQLVRAFALQFMKDEEIRETSPPAVDSRAYEHYLRGRYHHARDGEPGWPAMCREYAEAIAVDPRFAPPYAGLADTFNCYSLYATGLNDTMPLREAADRAHGYARKACELDPGSADGHAALGFSHMLHDWDWPSAQHELQLAISLNRNCWVAHQWYAWCLVQHGEFDAGLAEMEIARSLDPLSLPVNSSLGWFLYLARRPAQAIARLETTLTLGRHPMTLHALGLAYCQSGRLQDARAAMEESVRISMDHGLPLAGMVQIHAAAEEREQARRVLATMEALRETRIVSPYYLALAYAGAGDGGRCFDHLETAVREKSSWIPHASIEPLFDPLHGDPRWISLLRSIDSVHRVEGPSSAMPAEIERARSPDRTEASTGRA